MGIHAVGSSPGAGVHAALVRAWEMAGIPEGKCLHLMVDSGLEEFYHATYMATAANQAGLRTKIIRGLDGLQFAGPGDNFMRVLDGEGELISYVWKTWNWETIFDGVAGLPSVASEKASGPSLMDVLLDERITVWEPMWSTIANNKAILPVLWELYPHHPNLLAAEFELSAQLKNNTDGYVTKPIVGRCGSNVTMTSASGETIAEIGGKFALKDVIYQQIRNLPNINGKSVLVCPWAVSGQFAGLVLRVDDGLITSVESPVECAVVV